MNWKTIFSMGLCFAFVLNMDAQNVGVGEPDPDAKLEVKSDDTNEGSALRIKNVANDTLLEVTNDGRTGIFTGSPAIDAALDIQSTSRGILIPRLTTTERTLISGGAPSEGLMVYDTDTRSFWYFDQDQWLEIAAGDLSIFSTIEWLGTLDIAPTDPELNQAYYSEIDGKAYIYDGADWQVLVRDGLPGSKWYSGIGEPIQDGKNGDQYLDIKSGEVYQFSGGVWNVTASLQGPRGVIGKRGNLWKTDAGPPVPGLTDSIGDMYFNGINGDVYQYETTGWVPIHNLSGNRGSRWRLGQGEPSALETDSLSDVYLDGETGIVYQYDGADWNPQGGIKGRPGVDGNDWRTGPNAPLPLAGDSLGDFFFDATTGNVFEFHAEGWTLISNIAGDDGLRGNTWRNGNGDPTVLDRDSIGDFYLDNVTQLVYEFDGIEWQELIHLKGTPGVRGHRWSTGNGEPVIADQDSVGDLYLDVNLYDIYSYDGTGWNLKGNIRGDDGLRGHVWHTGTVSPTAIPDESEGDFYLNTATYELHQFDGTNWNLLTVIEGVDGVRGSVWSSGTGEPELSGTEQTDDYYLNEDNGDLYQFNGTAWGLTGGNIRGEDGLRGHVWHTGTIAPDAVPDESEGDFYLNTATYELHQFDGTNWNLLTVIEGVDGVRGSSWSSGTGEPDISGTEQTDDYYLNEDNGDLYQFNGTAWGLTGGNIRGEDGLRGNVWNTGSGEPGIIVGEENGDFYLDTDSYDLYLFDGTTWILKTTIEGTDGIRGSVWTSDSGPPENAGTELAGDFYLDVDNGDTYTHDGTDWVPSGNIRGADGQSFIAGSINNTLRNDGAEWVASSFLQSGTDFVGIGISTITTDASFNIEGNIKIVDGAQAEGKALVSDANGLASWRYPVAISDQDDNTSITTFNGADADEIQITTGGTQRMTITSTGKVGIGPDALTPGAQLHIDGDVIIEDGTEAAGKVLITDNNGAASWGYGTNLYSQDGQRWFVTDDGDDEIQIGINGMDKIIIDSDGEVGIGVTNPTTELDLNGSIRIADGSELRGKSLISEDNTGLGTWGYAYGIANADLSSSVFANGNAGDDIIMKVAGNEELFIDATSGNIGINGVATPSEALHVSGNIRLENATAGIGKSLVSSATGVGTWGYAYGIANADFSTSIFTNGSTGKDIIMKIANTDVLHIHGTSGNTGIKGVTNPTEALHINGNIRLENATAGLGKTLISDANGVGTWGYGNALQDNNADTKITLDDGTNPDQIIFETNGAQRMILDETGQLGVGVAAPDATFDLTGTMQYVDGNEGIGKVMTSDANGNVYWGNGNTLEDNNGDTRLVLENGNNPDSIIFYTDGVATAVMDEEQNMYIGTDNALGKLTVDGDIVLTKRVSPQTSIGAGKLYYDNGYDLPKMRAGTGHSWILNVDLAHFERLGADDLGEGTLSDMDWSARLFGDTRYGGGLFVTIASNRVFTLDSGTYYIRAKAAAYAVGMHQTRLLNQDNDDVLLLGTLVHAPAGMQTYSEIEGVISVLTPTKVKLEHKCENGGSENDQGVAIDEVAWGVNPVNASITFQRIQ